MIYLSFFWVHFKILKYSGPGDTFMSPAFQETLLGNELLLNAQGELCDGRLMLPVIADLCRDPILRHLDDQAQRHEAVLALA